MSDTVHRSPLHAYIFTRFREIFGQPTNSLQKDDHWAFQTLPTDHVINVLVNGTPSSPAVWIFDPYEAGHHVYNSAMADEAEVDEVIMLIQDRVKRAGQSSTGQDGTAPPSGGIDSASIGD
jgi:hypothetical protein